MTALIIYALLALTTAIACMYEVGHPVLQRIVKNNPTTNVAQNYWISFLVILIMFFVLAPLALILVIGPLSVSAVFSDSLYSALIQD